MGQGAQNARAKSQAATTRAKRTAKQSESPTDPPLPASSELESGPEMGNDPAHEPEPSTAAPKRGRPPKNMQKAATVTASTSSVHSSRSHHVVTNQDTLKPPTTAKGRKASKNVKDTTTAVAPTRPKCAVQSRSVSAAIPSGTTSKSIAGEEWVKEGSAEERRPRRKAAEAVNMLLDQANINDSMDDIYCGIEDDEGSPNYRDHLIMNTRMSMK